MLGGKVKEQESISRIAVIICLNVQFSTPNHEKCKETGKCDPYTEKKKKQARKTSCDWGGGGMGGVEGVMLVRGHKFSL